MTVINLYTPRLKTLLAPIPRYIGGDEPPAKLPDLRYLPTVESSAAAKAIAALGPEAVEDTLALLPKVPEHHQATLIDALARIGDERAVMPLCDIVDRGDDGLGMQVPALVALEKLASPAAIPCLTRHLTHPWESVRTRALRALISTRGPLAMVDLMPTLSAEDRRHLVKALTESDAPDVRPHLLAALDDPEADIRQLALERLAQTVSDDFVPRLIDCLADPVDAISNRAAHALRPRVGTLVDTLVSLLASKVANQRNAAMRLLSFTDDPALILRLGELLGSRSKKAARVCIVNALGELLPDEAAWTLLVKAVGDEALDVKEAAIKALTRKRDPAAIPILRDALMKPVAPYADRIIVKQLIRQKHPDATAVLADYVCSDLVAGTAFHEAVEGLAKLKARDVLPQLTARAESVAYPPRQATLRQLIETLS